MGSSTASTDETFCLKWNDFHASVASSFADLRRERDLLDVALVCGGDDGEEGEDACLDAHRVVLSACSGVFR